MPLSERPLPTPLVQTRSMCLGDWLGSIVYVPLVDHPERPGILTEKLLPSRLKRALSTSRSGSALPFLIMETALSTRGRVGEPSEARPCELASVVTVSA